MNRAAAEIGFFIVVNAVAVIAPARAAPAEDAAVYTTAQAERGKLLYVDKCSACHGGFLQGEEDNPPLTGKWFIGHWEHLPIKALSNFINKEMPLGQQGSITARDSADLTAYILSINHFPAGSEELHPDSARILSPNPAKQ